MLNSTQLKIVSYLAPNWFWVYEAIAAAISRTLQIDTLLLPSEHDPLNDSSLIQDEVDVAFICGLPFIRLYHQLPHLQAIAAPVMQLPRYENRPVYFADVIVSAASPLKTFADLENTVFCYNDRGSNSGYNLLLHRLRQGGCPQPFFGTVIQSGSHQRSIQWVASGQSDCAAIDSVVLERELQTQPELAARLRVIEAIGPCPMPPLAAAQRLGPLIDSIRAALRYPDPGLQQVFQQAGIQHFAAVRSEDYQPIAEIYQAVQGDQLIGKHW